MDQEHQHIEPIEADHAFEQLSGEVSLLRRAIEGLSAERQSAPDYAPTLNAMDSRLSRIERWASKIADTPLLSLTPDMLQQEIGRVAIAARQADRDLIERADASMTKAIAEVERVTESAWTASNQLRALGITGGISVLLTMGLTLALVDLGGPAPTKMPQQNVAPTIAPIDLAPQPMAPPRHHHPATPHRTAPK